MNKIGILAGTFDPIHIGHIKFAELAAEVLNLDKVVFMVEKSPRRKQKVTNLKTRQAMLELALAKRSNMQNYDSDQPVFSLPSTLPLLRERFPDSQFVILLGSDTAAHLESWSQIDNLESDVSFLIALRIGAGREALLEQLSHSTFADKLAFVDSPSPNKAASQIRTGHAKAGIDSVDKFISREHLYKT